MADEMVDVRELHYLRLGGHIDCEWDVPPDPNWSPQDVAHYEAVTFPAILSAIARVTGRDVLGMQT